MLVMAAVAGYATQAEAAPAQAEAAPAQAQAQAAQAESAQAEAPAESAQAPAQAQAGAAQGESAQAEPAHVAPAPQPLPRLAIFAGLALRRTWLSSDTANPPTQLLMLGSLAATVAYRVSEHLAFGVHANTARSTAHEEFWGHSYAERKSSSALAVDLAVAVQYEEGLFAIGTWLGRHFSRLHEDVETCNPRSPDLSCSRSIVTDWTSDFMSYGLTASVLLDRSFPLAVFVILQTGTGGARLVPGGSGPGYEYSAASLGISYRR